MSDKVNETEKTPMRIQIKSRLFLICLLVLVGLSFVLKPLVNQKDGDGQLHLVFSVDDGNVKFSYSFTPRYYSDHSSLFQHQTVKINERDYRQTAIYTYPKGQLFSERSREAILYNRSTEAGLEMIVLSSVPVCIEYPKNIVRVYDTCHECYHKSGIIDLLMGVYQFEFAVAEDSDE